MDEKEIIHFPAFNETREDILALSYEALEQVLKDVFDEEETPEDRWREFLK